MKTQGDLLRKIPIELRDIRFRDVKDMSDPSQNNQRDIYPSDYGRVFTDPQSQPGSTGYGAGTGMNPECKAYDHGTVPGGKDD